MPSCILRIPGDAPIAGFVAGHLLGSADVDLLGIAGRDGRRGGSALAKGIPGTIDANLLTALSDDRHRAGPATREIRLRRLALSIILGTAADELNGPPGAVPTSRLAGTVLGVNWVGSRALPRIGVEPFGSCKCTDNHDCRREDGEV